MPAKPIKDENYEFDAEFDAELDMEPGSGRKVGPASVAPVDAPNRLTKHSATLVRTAEELGFSKEDIEDSTPGELEKAVYHATRAHIAASKATSRSEILQNGTGRVEQVPVGQDAPSPSGSKEAAPEPEEEEDPFAEFVDEVSPGVLKALRKAAEVTTNRVKTLEAALSAGKEKEAATAQENLRKSIDGVFMKMPGEILAIIGKGELKDLAPDELQARKYILSLAEKDKTEGVNFGEKMLKAAQKLANLQAAEVEPEEEEDEEEAPPPAPKPRTAFVKKTPEERKRAWEKAGTAKPTARETPEPKGEKKAYKTAHKIMLERGMLNDEDLPDDAFPG